MIGLHEVVAPPPYVMVDGNFLTVDGHPVVAGSREYAYSGFDVFMPIRVDVDGEGRIVSRGAQK